METFLRFWRSFAADIISKLPQSPTIDSEALEVVRTYAGFINYVFPVGKFLAYVSAILVCAAVFYLYKVIMRQMRLIA